MHIVASPSAPDDIVKAPTLPNLCIDKKTETTNTFNGIPNKFIMMERCESGTYRLRSVPMLGKYIPTHASNTKKEPINTGRDMTFCFTVHVASDMAMVAADNIETVNVSVGMAILAN